MRMRPVHPTTPLGSARRLQPFGMVALGLCVPLLAACGNKGSDTATNNTATNNTAANNTASEDCTDGLDNDGNGLADCADPACSMVPACAGTDGGGTDAGGTDAGGTDAGGTDAGGTDAGGTDAGGTDAGGTDGGTTAGAGDVFINELMASNQTTIADPGGGYADWFELYNPGTEDLSLAGWTVTDDLAVPDKHPFDASLSVPAGGFLLLWADDNEPEGPDHVGFNLAARGEELGIYNAAGTRVDAVTFGKQVTDVSAARSVDGGSTWVLADPATPGTSNTGAR